MSCDRNTSQTEKDYIKNLEEKNKKLEMELQNFRGTKLDSTVQRKSEIANKYFTIGSTEDEVITVMGEPTSYLKTAPEAYKLLYGVSTVYFYKGKVISYEDLGGNLKARVRRQDSPKK